jgi:hypothetical protein
MPWTMKAVTMKSSLGLGGVIFSSTQSCKHYHLMNIVFDS